jgi:hypothetical protein
LSDHLEESGGARYLESVNDTPQRLSESFLPAVNSPPVEWRVSDDLIAYETALTEMDARVAAIIAGQGPSSPGYLSTRHSTPQAPARRITN